MSRSGWPRLPFSQVVEVNPKRPIRKATEVAFIDMASVPTSGGRVQVVQRRLFNGSGAKFKNGDTLFARITPCAENGKTAFVDCLEEGECGAGSTELIVFGPKPAVSDPLFIYHLAKSDQVRTPAILSMTGTTGRQRVPNDVFDRIEIALPSIWEQRRIAEILSSVDEAIQATEAVIEQTRKVISHVLDDLLASGIGHTRFLQTEIGELPSCWSVLPVDQLTPADRKVTYGIVQAGPHTPGGIPYIRVSDMGGRELTQEGMLRTSHEVAAKYQRSIVRTGDIVFALRGKLGYALPVPEMLTGANLTQGTARIAPGEKVSSEYLLWATRSRRFQEQVQGALKGSTFKEITLGDLKKVLVPIPPTEEQDRIATVLSGAESALWRSEDQLFAMRAAKSALMSDLLSGRKRVTDTMALAAE